MVLLLRTDTWIGSAELKQRVLDVVQRKFEGTGVVVTSDSELALMLDERPRQVLLHRGEFDQSGSETLGEQITPFDAEVNVQEVANAFPGGENDVAEAIGAIVSHEAGHLMLPTYAGHSIDGVNLLSAGAQASPAIGQDHGRSLEFTEFQKDLIAGRVELPAGQSLAQVEAVGLSGIPIDADKARALAEGAWQSDPEGEPIDVDVELFPDLGDFLA